LGRTIALVGIRDLTDLDIVAKPAGTVVDGVRLPMRGLLSPNAYTLRRKGTELWHRFVYHYFTQPSDRIGDESTRVSQPFVQAENGGRPRFARISRRVAVQDIRMQEQSENAVDRVMMERCIELSRTAVAAGEFPFASLIARGNEIIAARINRVARDRDNFRGAEGARQDAAP
jgi:hypothetical protein